MEVNIDPRKKQSIIQQAKLKLPKCPSCKRNNWLEFNKSDHFRNCENIFNKQKHLIDKKVLRKYHYFTTRIIFANKKTREISCSMANTTYKSTEDMIII